MAGRLGSLLKGWGSGAQTFAASAERLRRQGQLEQAVETCRNGLEQFPEQLSARVTLGCALLDLGRLDEARVELEYVIRRAPDNLAAIRGLAQLHDQSETSALLALEHAGDWPPRQEEIERAVAEHRETPAAPAAAVADESLPESAVELLEEADALDAIADETEQAAADAPTLELDPDTGVDFEELASELAAPGGEAGQGLSNRSDPSDPEAAELQGRQPDGAPNDADEPIVLDAESLDGNLDDYADLGNDGGDDERGRDPEPAEHADVNPVRTESALDALERMLGKVKTRRRELTSDSAA